MINLIKYGLTGVIASSLLASGLVASSEELAASFFLLQGLNATAVQTEVQKYEEHLKCYKIDYLHMHGTQHTSGIDLNSKATFPAVKQHLQDVGWKTLHTRIPDLITTEKAKQSGDPTKKNPRVAKVVTVGSDLQKHVKGGKVPHIEVIESGTLDAVYRFRNSGKVAFVNFGNAIQACGGVLKGYGAQEENLSRGTSIAASLMTLAASSGYYKKNRIFSSEKKKWVANASEDYGSNKTIISPDVAIFNDGNGKAFPNLCWATGITAAAPNLRSEVLPEDLGKIDAIMLNLIRQILQSAHDEGCTTIVLGAFGCGVYGHDPVIVANYFKQVLIDENYGSYFDNISFAILPEKGNNRTNLIAFQKVLPSSTAPMAIAQPVPVVPSKQNKDQIADKGNNARAREIIARQRQAAPNMGRQQGKALEANKAVKPATVAQPNIQKQATPVKAVPVNNKALGGNNAKAREIIERQRNKKAGMGGFF